MLRKWPSVFREKVTQVNLFAITFFCFLSSFFLSHPSKSNSCSNPEYYHFYSAVDLIGYAFWRDFMLIQPHRLGEMCFWQTVEILFNSMYPKWTDAEYDWIARWIWMSAQSKETRTIPRVPSRCLFRSCMCVCVCHFHCHMVKSTMKYYWRRMNIVAAYWILGISWIYWPVEFLASDYFRLSAQIHKSSHFFLPVTESLSFPKDIRTDIFIWSACDFDSNGIDHEACQGHIVCSRFFFFFWWLVSLAQTSFSVAFYQHSSSYLRTHTNDSCDLLGKRRQEKLVKMQVSICMGIICCSEINYFTHMNGILDFRGRHFNASVWSRQISHDFRWFIPYMCKVYDERNPLFIQSLWVNKMVWKMFFCCCTLSHFPTIPIYQVHFVFVTHEVKILYSIP